MSNGTNKTLDELVALLTVQTTVAGGVAVLLDKKSGIIATLKQALADALSGVNVPQAVQTKINDAFGTAEATTAQLTAAALANTDVEVLPPVEPA